DRDDDPRRVAEVEDGEVELVREGENSGQLAGGGRGQPAAVDPGVGGHDRHGVAVQTRQGGDDGAAVAAAQLEQRVPVNDQSHQPAHVIDLAAAAGDDAAGRGFGPERVIVALLAGCLLPAALGEGGA